MFKLNKLKSLSTNSKGNIGKYASSIFLALSLQQPVKADFTTNLIVNPAYSWFPGNVYNILWDDNDLKNPKLKKTFNNSKKILSNYYHGLDEEELNKLNKKYLFMITNFHKNKKYSAAKFIDEFLSLSNLNGLNYSSSINLFLDYYNQGFLPQFFQDRFRKDFEYGLDLYLTYYGKTEFTSRFKKVIDLYSSGNLGENEIKHIFPEMFAYEEKKAKYILFIVLGLFIFYLSFYSYLEYREKNFK